MQVIVRASLAELLLHVLGDLVHGRGAQFLEFAGAHAVSPFEDLLEEAQVLQRAGTGDGHSNAGQVVAERRLVGAAQSALDLHLADRSSVSDRLLHVEDDRIPVRLLVGVHGRVEEKIIGLQDEAAAQSALRCAA